MSTYPTPPAPAPEAPPIRPLPQGVELRDSRNIQGNILAAFNKDHQALLFLQFPAAVSEAQQFVAGFLPFVSVNADVAKFNEAFSQARRLSGSDPDDLNATWLSFSLTAHGLSVLAPASQPVLQLPSWDGAVAAFQSGPAVGTRMRRPMCSTGTGKVPSRMAL